MIEQKSLNIVRAYVFPGQGSQVVGMGADLYENSPAAKDVFDAADESLGFPLSDLIFHGPVRKLQDTVNSQPAIMTVSIACLKAMEEELGTDTVVPKLVAGHSLGEYTSMVVAGVTSFADGVRLVRQRGQLMQQASVNRPGGMAAAPGPQARCPARRRGGAGHRAARPAGGLRPALSPEHQRRAGCAFADGVLPVSGRKSPGGTV